MGLALCQYVQDTARDVQRRREGPGSLLRTEKEREHGLGVTSRRQPFDVVLVVLLRCVEGDELVLELDVRVLGADRVDAHLVVPDHTSVTRIGRVATGSSTTATWLLVPQRWGRHRVGPLRLAAYVDRPAGLLAGLLAPLVASYTAVLLSNTSTPSWNAARHELPFVFVGSAAAASGGFALVTARKANAG